MVPLPIVDNTAPSKAGQGRRDNGEDHVEAGTDNSEAVPRVGSIGGSGRQGKDHAR